MEDVSKIGSSALLGDADPVPQSLFLSHPEQANTLTLLYEVSREITSILDREELLRRVAERIKKIVKYHVFSVMLWNEQTQHLETAFAMCCGDSLPLRMRVPLNIGLTGTAAGERRVLRINDVTDDSRYIRCESGVTVRSELVVPLLLRDRLARMSRSHSKTPASTRRPGRANSECAASWTPRGRSSGSSFPPVRAKYQASTWQPVMFLHAN